MSIFRKIIDVVWNKGKRMSEEERKNALLVFEKIKSSLYTESDSSLNKYAIVAKEKILEFAQSGQLLAKAKMEWLMETAGRERKLIREYGITKCIRREDISRFVEQHPTRVIQISDLADYERSIPTKIRQKISEVKDVFDSIVIMYTDHTKPLQRKIEKVKDPIAFGIFVGNIEVDVPSYDSSGLPAMKKATTAVMSDRLYFIGDWEDEMCDLTLDRLVEESSKMLDEDIDVFEPDKFVHPSERMPHISESDQR